MPHKDRTTLDYLHPGTEDRVRARENFRLTDADGNQQITFVEFAAFMTDLDPEMTADEHRIGFDEIDTDHDGVISFEEFRAWLQS
ncbi:Ca2+-binding EF-hand superfamily protein [Povalibacter uvarum]|uniref:Ca2+-binding EF-hand superfamily protein n=1 Tax=Povalibacter uvarum TaxID=732238 RepID=A0A841HLV4_9GAMM|nr:EF-hand domain-containing protein [Povalibacter uvarum]MBB6093339.1 Ca2+-binding EF-hand superfamily protein [Povalibacter uvarum]